MKKKALFVILIILFIYSPCLAKTDQFFLEYGSNLPPTFLGLESSRKVTQVFINPAGIYQNQMQSIKIDYAQALFGYTYLSFAYLLPLNNFSLGIGYQNFSSNDIPKTAVTEPGSRPEITGYLLDQQNKFDLNLAYAFTKNLYAGAGLHLYTENFANSILSQGLYSNLGLYCLLLENLQIGASYSLPLRRIQKALSLSEKYTDIPYSWNFEAFYKFWCFQTGFVYQAINRTGFLELYLTDNFSFTVQNTWDKTWQNQNLSLGAIIDLNLISLQYYYVIMFKEGIELSQNIFSVKFNF